MHKHASLGLNGIGVIGIQPLPPAAKLGQTRLPMAQPGCMNTIARPENMATGNALVGLHQIKTIAANDIAHGFGKAAITIHPTKGQTFVRRVHNFDLTP